MPSEQGLPPGPPTAPAKERSPPSKAGSSEGPRGQSEKKGRGGEAAREPRHPPSEGEKDSGFSDVSSEYLSVVEQTDTEDAPAFARQLPTTQPPSQEQQLAKSPRAPAKPPGGLAGGPFPGLAPVYIVKNVVFKQPLGASPTTPFLAWSSQHPLDAAQAPPASLLLLQPPVSSLKPLCPSPKTSAKETYLPILSTYPKIAPHPGHNPQAKGPAKGGAAPAEGTKKNKRFCLEESWAPLSDPAPPKGRKERQREGVPCQDTVSSSTGLNAAEGRMISRASRKLGGSSLGKQRRFHNTVEILRRSGLLGITLRTKELLRQNSATQRELAELREHARLLCEAFQSNDGQAWARLQEAVDHSAAYWARKGAHVPTPQPGGCQQGRGAEPPGSGLEPAVDSPPCSPMNLSLTPDVPVPTTLP